MFRRLFRNVQIFLENVIFSLAGFLVLFGGLPIYILVSLPVYLYRWLLVKVLAPLFKGDSGKAVTAFGAFLCSELKGDSSKAPPRCAVVLNLVMEGAIPLELMRETLQKRFIGAKGSSGEPLYPESQQYVGSWMGYMFWNEDKSFRLDNHLKSHTCPESWTEAECEYFARSKVEELLAKPFPQGRSPWEVHLINGYRNSEFLPNGQEMTLVLVRFHHSLGDGFSMLYVLCEGVLDIPLSQLDIATPSKVKSAVMKQLNHNSLAKLLNYTSLPLRIVRDFGYYLYITLRPIPSPWYIPDREKTHRQLYARSGMIPISKVKTIKSKFGVSFTSVLLSSMGAGIAKCFQGKGFRSSLKVLPLVVILPTKDHPNKLRNHFTGTILQAVIEPELSPLQRLKKAEERFQQGKRSTYPLLFQIILKLFAAQPPAISDLLLENRTASTGLTNFPGPNRRMEWLGFKVISNDFAAGQMIGVLGVDFMVLSYHDHIRIGISADGAGMNRQEMDGLLEAVCQEIDQLYELAMREKSFELEICEDSRLKNEQT